MWKPAISWCTALLLCLLFSDAAHGENIVFASLNASLDDGSLAGTTFQILFSYDADQVADAGDSYVTLNSFDFTLLGVSFTRDDIFQGGQVIFQDGVLQNVTASFQVFLPPGAPVQNITFGFGDPMGIAYIDLDGGFGAGSLELVSDLAVWHPAVHAIQGSARYDCSPSRDRSTPLVLAGITLMCSLPARTAYSNAAPRTTTTFGYIPLPASDFQTYS